jgi:hypothetical protein
MQKHHLKQTLARAGFYQRGLCLAFIISVLVGGSAWSLMIFEHLPSGELTEKDAEWWDIPATAVSFVNHPLRVTGFMEIAAPGGTTVGFRLRKPKDLDHLIKRFAKIEAASKTVRLKPFDGWGGAGTEQSGPLPVLFYVRSRDQMDLTLFVEHKYVDLKKLQIPPQLDVRLADQHWDPSKHTVVLEQIDRFIETHATKQREARLQEEKHNQPDALNDRRAR